MENQIHPEAEATSGYVVPSLGLADGWFIFAYVSSFLSYITPQDLPVGNFTLILGLLFYGIECGSVFGVKKQQ